MSVHIPSVLLSQTSKTKQKAFGNASQTEDSAVTQHQTELDDSFEGKKKVVIRRQ